MTHSGGAVGTQRVVANPKDRISWSRVPCTASLGEEKGCLNFLSSRPHFPQPSCAFQADECTTEQPEDAEQLILFHR